MSLPVEAVLFDMGGTLRKTVKRSDQERRQKVHQILQLLGAQRSVDEFACVLSERSRAYKQWAEETESELGERQLWTQWMLPDYPEAQVAPLAVQLNEIWRNANSQYVVLPETKEVILTLFRRGYRLGLISNTTSSVEVPRTFEELQITGCFETVILSCVLGKRKPDPEMLLAATQAMGIDPSRCAYVGDIPRRDVRAARAAGFARAIIISETLTEEHLSSEPELKPDHIVRSLREVVRLFPPRDESLPSAKPGRNGRQAEDEALYDASLSTMWAMRNFPGLEDFFRAARRMGFGKIELNHQVSGRMLEGIDLSRYAFSSVHEPCPADIPLDELKERDWLISSTDEEKRRLGVEAVVKSIRLAAQLGVTRMVVHPGTTGADYRDCRRYYALFNAGQAGTPEYLGLRQKLIEQRAAQARPHLEAVKRSLMELLEISAPLGIRLGLENRFHFIEIPIIDEMEELLNLAGPEQLGFWYDMGHAQVLDRLGFFPHAEWLRRYAARIIGVHIHDAAGTSDHQPLGSGELNFEQLLSYIPADAVRTFEIKPSHAPEKVKRSLHLLAEKGFLKCL